MADINKAMAAQIWDAITVTVERFTPKITPHDQSCFLGYADITIDVPALPGLTFRLRGLGVKTLKGNPRLEMAQEQGADGKYYPHYFPLSGELREVLTMKVFKHQPVLAAVEQAARLAQPEQSVAAGEENPFAG